VKEVVFYFFSFRKVEFGANNFSANFLKQLVTKLAKNFFLEKIGGQIG
jgi:hypothetical protein